MKLLRLHVENFGKLQNYELSLVDGLNVLYQKNGWGKSTLAVFIKAMLYGLPASSRRSLDENERKKYAPWQGGAYGGSLEFCCERGSFRIERFFGAKESGDSFSLYDLSTNKPSTAFSESVGVELFGIDADGFERSTYLSQRALDMGKENNSISAKLGDLLDDVGDIGNYDTAIEALDKRRRHFVMTGNRGAIAEMEQARVEKQTELERCMRVREAMEAQEAELSACSDEIRSIQSTANETRHRLQKAGLAREHAAHLEQKKRMDEELASLQIQKQQNDAFFHSAPPSPDELSQRQALYEQIREESVRLDTLSKESPDHKSLLSLRATYQVDGAPALLEQMESDNNALQALRAKREALIGARDADGLMHRFPNGAPKKERLDEAFLALEQANKLQETVKSFENTEKAGSARYSAFFLPGILLVTIGVVLSLLSRLPALVALVPVFLACGFFCVGIGAILCIAGILTKKANQKRVQAMLAKKQEWETRRESALQRVKKLLAEYRMPLSDDLSRRLTELSVLSSQYYDGKRKCDLICQEIERLNRQCEELITNLRRSFLLFSCEAAPKEDYRADLERIRADLAYLQRLEHAEQLREQERNELEASLTQKKAELLPFLRRFDPSGRMRAGECLSLVGERLAERTRLLQEIAQKQAARNTFVADKQLSGLSSSVDPDEFDRLSAEERELLGKLENAQRKHTLLKSSIERLSLDADRIPELESTLVQMKEQIDEARANYTTLMHTAKFLEEAKTALSTRYLDGMQKSFTGFLTDLIGENSPEALMDTSFDVRLREGGQTRTMESFSRGWRDAVQFCVRLSLTDALYADTEPPFLLLDDPFVNLDDTRLAAARALLDKLSQTHQILYLVCHKDRV